MASALGSRLSALGSRLSALGSRLSALGSRLSALGSRLSLCEPPDQAAFVKPFFEQSITFLPPRRSDRETARARRPVRSFSTSSSARFRSAPSNRRIGLHRCIDKTLTAGIQSGTSNMFTPDPSPLPDSLSKSHTSCETERLWAMGHFNLGKCAALLPARFPAHLAENKVHAHAQAGWRPGRSSSMRHFRTGSSNSEFQPRQMGTKKEQGASCGSRWRPSSAAIATTGS